MTVTGLLRRGWNGLNKVISRRTLPLMLRPNVPRSSLTWLGTGDGAWPISLDLLPSRSVCYCVGVGLNASFDLALASRDYEVHSFDPTPKAKDYASRENLAEKGVHFHPLGLWNEQKVLRFYAPSNPLYPNYSVVDLHGTAECIEAQCETLEHIMAKFAHRKIALLKLDVEGSWPSILEHLLTSAIRPGQLCVEFDSPTSLAKILRMIRLLKDAGYTVAWFQRENFLFVHELARSQNAA
jgi:FkbM family methyltransferase